MSLEITAYGMEVNKNENESKFSQEIFSNFRRIYIHFHLLNSIITALD